MKLIPRLCWKLSILFFLCSLQTYEVSAQTKLKESSVPALKTRPSTDKPQIKGWSRVTVGEPPIFTAEFPNPPQQVTNRTSGNDGEGTWHVFMAANETALYEVVWGVSESGLKNKSEKENFRDFNNFAAGFVDGLSKTGRVKGAAELNLERRIRHSRTEGFEREYSFAEHQVRVQMFPIGKDSLAIVSLWNSDNQAAERNAFFNSVKFEMETPLSDKVAESPLAGWKRYQVGSHANVMLPAEPKETKSTQVSGISRPQGTYYRLDEPDYYSIGVLPGADFGKLTPREIDALYEQLWPSVTGKMSADMIRSGLPGKFQQSPVRTVMMGRIRAQEREFALGGIQGRARIALASDSLYIVVAAWTTETPLAVREAFFESFTIN